MEVTGFTALTTWLERHQVPLYVSAMGMGVLIGLTFPQAAPFLGPLINPSIAVMLWATFLSIPLTRLAEGFRDLRFLATVLALNFVAVPAVVWALTRPLAEHPELLLGVLLVLLVPCIDWVIVFTGLAGGDSSRMTAAAPLLMVTQMVVLAPLLVLIGGPGLMVEIAPAPFLTALLGLLVLPLAAAAVVQGLAPRFRGAARVQGIGQGLMVPALMMVLLVVTASQVPAVGARWAQLAWTVPVFVGFVVVMVALSSTVVRLSRMTTPVGRAIVFSSVARNSLVVLPFALALADGAPGTGRELIPLVVLTQTLVELVAMVVLLRVVPWLLPVRRTSLRLPPVRNFPRRRG